MPLSSGAIKYFQSDVSILSAKPQYSQIAV